MFISCILSAMIISIVILKNTESGGNQLIHIAMFFYSRSESGQFCRGKYRDMASGSTTSTWSLKLIFGGFVVLMSTLLGRNMSCKLHVEVVEPDVMSLYFPRQNGPLLVGL